MGGDGRNDGRRDHHSGSGCGDRHPEAVPTNQSGQGGLADTGRDEASQQCSGSRSDPLAGQARHRISILVARRGSDGADGLVALVGDPRRRTMLPPHQRQPDHDDSVHAAQEGDRRGPGRQRPDHTERDRDHPGAETVFQSTSLEGRSGTHRCAEPRDPVPVLRPESRLGPQDPFRCGWPGGTRRATYSGS